MASNSSKRKTTTNNRTTSKSTAYGNNRRRKGKNARGQAGQLRDEILVLFAFAFALILMLSNFNLAGIIGQKIKWFMFGLFGLVEYVFPVILAGTLIFLISNKYLGVARIKTAAVYVLTILICGLVQLMSGKPDIESTGIFEFFRYSAEKKLSGGLFGGMISKGLIPLGVMGAYVILIILAIICVIIITERSFIGGVKNKSARMYQSAREDYESYKLHSAETHIQRSEYDLLREEKREQERLARKQRKEAERNQKQLAIGQDEEIKVPRTSKKARGITSDTTIHKENTAARSVDVHEITIDYDRQDAYSEDIYSPLPEENNVKEDNASFESVNYSELQDNSIEAELVSHEENNEYEEAAQAAANEFEHDSIATVEQIMEEYKTEDSRLGNEDNENRTVPKKKAAKYIFPSLNLLKKNDTKGVVGQERENRETAIHLQQTLQNFGVKVTITDISCGPAVTRYELQPEQGVKVSKIVSLSDDIKLNLAAADIRIEAPIPGKAAIGIEVPNKETKGVSLRELLESDTFKKNPSAVCFAAGKDIAGKTIVADIAKMPHLLIAGATGSGKSVCINTIIMSILYKANPEDVKLIMVDPKVVELSVYNGIPHLMIPVVTDPKKASGALNWAVAEMTERYKKFADMNVRDLKGYNTKAEELSDGEDENAPKKMPQIVIIIDELADLMMVAPGEVEDAICRLAQLARAAGIHLVIATQRPSVNVITGLIKANVPSRIAFSVSSGVDSRTIIDMNGAEKLLGKGDMLFFPSGYPKPVRVQGAFVSDSEVGNVVEFLKKNMTEEVVYSEDVTQQIENASFNDSQAFGGDRDSYFAEAGRFIIEKEKGSIGMLQRYYKIGFNRAARIMDQLTEAGVVGPEEGTKPRKILMTLEEFEQIVRPQD